MVESIKPDSEEQAGVLSPEASLLAVSSIPLWPLTNGAVLRCVEILRALGSRWTIHLVAPPWEGAAANTREWGLSGFFPVPLQGRWTYYPGQYDPSPLVKGVRKALDHLEPEAALLFSGTEFLARKVPDFPPSVADRIDCMTVTQFRMLFGPRGGRSRLSVLHDLLLVFLYERGVARLPFATVTVGHEDARWLKWVLGTRNVHLISNGVKAGPDPGPAAETKDPTVVFSGVMDYPPNADAANFFAREVWPHVVSARPAARFRIAGRQPTRDVLMLGKEKGVEVLGEVPDMGKVLAEAWVAVAPIRLGSGVRNKVLEAWAAGTPVVMTRMATNGLPEVPDFDSLVEDDPRRMAQTVLSLLDNAAERARLGRLAYQTALARSWEAVGDSVHTLLVQARDSGMA